MCLQILTTREKKKKKKKDRWSERFLADIAVKKKRKNKREKKKKKEKEQKLSRDARPDLLSFKDIM